MKISDLETLMQKNQQVHPRIHVRIDFAYKIFLNLGKYSKCSQYNIELINFV